MHFRPFIFLFFAACRHLSPPCFFLFLSLCVFSTVSSYNHHPRTVGRHRESARACRLASYEWLCVGLWINLPILTYIHTIHIYIYILYTSPSDKNWWTCPPRGHWNRHRPTLLWKLKNQEVRTFTIGMKNRALEEPERVLSSSVSPVPSIKNCWTTSSNRLLIN